MAIKKPAESNLFFLAENYINPGTQIQKIPQKGYILTANTWQYIRGIEFGKNTKLYFDLDGILVGIYSRERFFRFVDQRYGKITHYPAGPYCIERSASPKPFDKAKDTCIFDYQEGDSGQIKIPKNDYAFIAFSWGAAHIDNSFQNEIQGYTVVRDRSIDFLKLDIGHLWSVLGERNLLGPFAMIGIGDVKRDVDEKYLRYTMYNVGLNARHLLRKEDGRVIPFMELKGAVGMATFKQLSSKTGHSASISVGMANWNLNNYSLGTLSCEYGIFRYKGLSGNSVSLFVGGMF